MNKHQGFQDIDGNMFASTQSEKDNRQWIQFWEERWKKIQKRALINAVTNARAQTRK